MPQLSASGEVLKALAQFAPVIAMQSKFANQLLEPRSMLRLAFDFTQDDRIRDHVPD